MKNPTTGKVAETLNVGALRIDRYTYDTDDAPERSVFAYDRSGKLVWQIAAPPFRFLPIDWAGYAGLRTAEGKLFVGVTIGYEVEVSLEDGSVSMVKEPGRFW